MSLPVERLIDSFERLSFLMYCSPLIVVIHSPVSIESKMLCADSSIVCSDIPVHREVASDFAALVNPLQYQDWESFLTSISSLKKPSLILGKDAFMKRRDYFSKERMVQDHLQAYTDLLA